MRIFGNHQDKYIVAEEFLLSLVTPRNRGSHVAYLLISFSYNGGKTNPVCYFFMYVCMNLKY